MLQWAGEDAQARIKTSHRFRIFYLTSTNYLWRGLLQNLLTAEDP
jgi:hypothetical protein